MSEVKKTTTKKSAAKSAAKKPAAAKPKTEAQLRRERERAEQHARDMELMKKIDENNARRAAAEAAKAQAAELIEEDEVEVLGMDVGYGSDLTQCPICGNLFSEDETWMYHGVIGGQAVAVCSPECRKLCR